MSGDQSFTVDSPWRDNDPRSERRPKEPVEIRVERFCDWISIGVMDSNRLTDVRMHVSEWQAILPHLKELLDDKAQ